MLTAHLNAEQFRIAGWYYFDGMDQHDIAELLGCTRQRVGQHIAKIVAVIRKLGMPEPKRFEHPYTTRSVRTMVLSGY